MAKAAEAVKKRGPHESRALPAIGSTKLELIVPHKYEKDNCDLVKCKASMSSPLKVEMPTVCPGIDEHTPIVPTTSTIQP
jgi:hypothetical protein